MNAMFESVTSRRNQIIRMFIVMIVFGLMIFPASPAYSQCRTPHLGLDGAVAMNGNQGLQTALVGGMSTDLVALVGKDSVYPAGIGVGLGVNKPFSTDPVNPPEFSKTRVMLYFPVVIYIDEGSYHCSASYTRAAFIIGPGVSLQGEENGPRRKTIFLGMRISF